MRVHHSVRLNCSPGRFKEELLKTSSLLYISAPMVMFKPIDPPQLTETWVDGQTYLVQVLLFGFIPFGKQAIVISVPNSLEPGVYFQQRDNGYSDRVKRWDHMLRIIANPDGTTTYSDTVEVEAGVMTLLTWIYAWFYYRHRQKRWLSKFPFESRVQRSQKKSGQT